MQDPLLEWLKERLYADRDPQEVWASPPAELVPEEQRAVVESRGPAQQLLEIWHQLRRSGVAPPREDALQVLGLLVEIGFPEGPDTVAAYMDGSSQFLSREGVALMGEDPRPEVEEAARHLIAVAGAFVYRARRMHLPRKPPGPQMVQFTFLTPSGPLLSSCSKTVLRSGHGELSALFEPAAELIERKVEGLDDSTG
ncbi:MAG TPA: hypothetical protein VIG99_17260 [Myxococcaceae bacterium]|jgi:hypothetical protein